MNALTRPRFVLKEGWSTLLLLWSLIFVSALAIMQADLISGLHVVAFSGTAALIVGVALSKSRFSPNVSHFFALIYGLFVVFYLVGTTLPADMAWRERIFDLMQRQGLWIRKAFEGGTSRDGLIFVIQTSAIYWLLGYTAAWYTFRQPRIWRAVVPTGIVMLSVVYYYTGPKRLSLYVAAFAVLALMFVARTHLAAQEEVWKAKSVRYEKTIWFTFLRAGFLASLIALVLSWSLPTMAASPAVSDALSGTRGPWRDFQDNWTRLFSALRSYGAQTSDPYQDTLVLGGPRTIGSTLIMDVYVPRQLPSVYWQAIVYDTYEDGRWQSAESESVLHFPDDGFLQTPFTGARSVITQTVVNYLPKSSFIYGAPEVVGSNRQIFVESTFDPEGKRLISALRSRFVLEQGDRYNVVSQISTVDAESLRISSTNYPDWVRETYLQVPDTITPETINLAQEITADVNTPFDSAIAIRDYLRANITYNDQIPAPPEGIDPVHHTLFVSREGYCNYYASSMAMMLRTLGIPARVVSGYAQGEYNEDIQRYRVRATNAHTWVEVFFPLFGWIQFEPTASIPTVARPEGSGGGDAFPSTANDRPLLDGGEEFPPFEELDPLNFEGAIPEPDQVTFWTRIGSFFGGLSGLQIAAGALILFLALVAILVASQFNRRVESDVERSYSRIGAWANWIGVQLQPAHTPFERADLMTTAVPEGTSPIRNLTRQFVKKRFSRERSEDEGFDPLGEWRLLRPILLRQAIANRLHRFQLRNRR